MANMTDIVFRLIRSTGTKFKFRKGSNDRILLILFDTEQEIEG